MGVMSCPFNNCHLVGIRVVGLRGLSNHFCDARESPLYMGGVSLWEALFVVSQKWSFPTGLVGIFDRVKRIFVCIGALVISFT